MNPEQEQARLDVTMALMEAARKLKADLDQPNAHQAVQTAMTVRPCPVCHFSEHPGYCPGNFGADCPNQKETAHGPD